jgi:hypothetical protein
MKPRRPSTGTKQTNNKGKTAPNQVDATQAQVNLTLAQAVVGQNQVNAAQAQLNLVNAAMLGTL